MIRGIAAPCLFLLLLLPCFVSNAQNSISGEIKNIPPGHIQLILEEDINRKKSRMITEIPIDKKGRFFFHGKLSPNIYSLKMADNSSLVLAIDKDQKIIITGTGTDIATWKVAGSADTKILMDYETFRKTSLNRLVNSVRNNIKVLKQKGAADTDSTILELSRLEVENYNLHRDELIHYISTQMGTSLAIYPTSIRWSGEKNILFLSGLAEKFEAAHPGTAIAKKISEKVNVLIANIIGGKVAAITMPDKDGTIVPLYPIKGKYVLVDFWASWCAPCRRESPLLIELYQQYKSAGLEIYGVGMDNGKETWLGAIEKNQRSWINVSSFQGFETPASFDYGVTSLPSNILIDESGKVIAKDLHGDELRKLMDTLF